MFDRRKPAHPGNYLHCLSCPFVLEFFVVRQPLVGRGTVKASPRGSPKLSWGSGTLAVNMLLLHILEQLLLTSAPGVLLVRIDARAPLCHLFLYDSVRGSSRLGRLQLQPLQKRIVD